MQKDLFGKKVIQKKTRLETSLLRYDKRSLNERVERLKYINKIIPKGYGIAADMETVYVFDEAKMTFINGEFISTVLLSQAFIERKLQMFMKADQDNQRKEQRNRRNSNDIHCLYWLQTYKDVHQSLISGNVANLKPAFLSSSKVKPCSRAAVRYLLISRATTNFSLPLACFAFCLKYSAVRISNLSELANCCIPEIVQQITK